jgi:hypothetical protein
LAGIESDDVTLETAETITHPSEIGKDEARADYLERKKMASENFLGPAFESLETELTTGPQLGPSDDSDVSILEMLENLKVCAMTGLDYFEPVVSPVAHGEASRLSKAAPNTSDLDEDAAEAIFALDLKTLLVPGSGITPQPVPARESGIRAPVTAEALPDRFEIDPELTLHKRKRRSEMNEAELKLDDAMDSLYVHLTGLGETPQRARELAGYLRGAT